MTNEKEQGGSIMEQKIKNIIMDNMAREARNIAVFEAVREALAKSVGKQITRRMAAAAQEKLGAGWIVGYVRKFSGPLEMAALDIRPVVNGAPDYEQKIELDLGHVSEPFTFENRPRTGMLNQFGYDSLNAWAGKAAKERNQKREALLADRVMLHKLAAAVEAFNVARRELLGFLDPEDFDDRIEDGYAIKKLLDGEGKI